jgi:aconitate hydratase
MGDVLRVRDLRGALARGDEITLDCGGPIAARHGLTRMQVDVILAGGLINWRRQQRAA